MAQVQSKRSVYITYAACAAVVVTVAGGTAVAVRQNITVAKPVNQAQPQAASAPKLQSTLSSPATPGAAAHTMPVTSDAQASSTSSTTVTVNGQTTRVSSTDGNSSFHKSYTSSDGSSKLNVSVTNTTKQTSSSEDAMQ